MTSKAKLFATLNVSKEARRTADDSDNALAELMANPEYLRHSSAIINDALKDGFDVLQLPNGDIVTTGTKTIVNTFVWDAKNERMDKARSNGDKTRTRKSAKAKVDEEVDE